MYTHNVTEEEAVSRFFPFGRLIWKLYEPLVIIQVALTFLHTLHSEQFKKELPSVLQNCSEAPSFYNKSYEIIAGFPVRGSIITDVSI